MTARGFYRKDGKTHPITAKKRESQYDGQTEDPSSKESSIKDLNKGEDKIATIQFVVAKGEWGTHELKEDFYVSRTKLDLENQRLIDKYGSHPYIAEVEKTSIDTNADGKVTKGRPERQRIGSFYKSYAEAVDAASQVAKSKKP